jgi:hypothetical protein
MDQYIHDNTEDEFTHHNFLNAYLVSKGAAPVSLEKFRTLPGSTATGSSGRLRLTNLMQLTLDTSWWTRYRSRTEPRPQSRVPVSTGHPWPEQRAIYGNPEDRCRPNASRSHPGNR